MKLQTQKLLRSANSATQARDFIKAGRALGKALTEEPDNIDVRIKYATNLFALNEFAKAAECFHKLHIDHPDDARAWNGCAVSYLRLGSFEVAIQFLKKIVGKDNTDYESWLNLCFAAGSAGKHSDTLFYAMQALQVRPTDPRSHNNLGCALLALNRFRDALTSFETSLKLDPNNLDALSNIATIYSLNGYPDEAIATYERCMQLAGTNREFKESIQYRMSFDFLRTGRLREAWVHYDHGFKPVDSRSRSPKRSFPVPLWDGSPLGEKRLLVWREQGLGDELMFFAALREVEPLVKNLIIECDRRLVPVLKRSFPQALVRTEQIQNRPGFPPTEIDMDVHLPAGSLMRLFRNSIDDFRRTEAYIIPDAERQAEFRRRLAALPGKKKVGICWRSGTLNAERNSSYTSISDWEPLLRRTDIDIINLQYGDCREEVDNVARHFGVVLHQWEDLDLRNDLDGVFALASCLDHVVSVTTAPSVMAAAVGTPTSVLMPRSAWTLFGSDEYLILPGLTPYICQYGQPLKERIPDLVAGTLAAMGLDAVSV